MKNKLSIIRLISVIMASIGAIMLVIGLFLSLLTAGERANKAKAQMPEEYIEEFFSDNQNDSTKLLEPEYKAE